MQAILGYSVLLLLRSLFLEPTGHMNRRLWLFARMLLRVVQLYLLAYLDDIPGFKAIFFETPWLNAAGQCGLLTNCTSLDALSFGKIRSALLKTHLVVVVLVGVYETAMKVFAEYRGRSLKLF